MPPTCSKANWLSYVDRSEVEARMASLDVRAAAPVMLSLDVIAGQSVEPGHATVGESTHPTRQRLATALFTEADRQPATVFDQYGGTEQRWLRIRRISPAPLCNHWPLRSAVSGARATVRRQGTAPLMLVEVELE